MVLFAVLAIAARFDPSARWSPVSYILLFTLLGALGASITRHFSEQRLP
jgi:hypothetical protein